MSLSFPYIDAGTSSVSAGATAVTGVSTAWLAAGVRAGDLYVQAGLAVPIGVDATTNTGLTLARSWPGSTQTAQPYHIIRAVDADRVMTAAREFIALFNLNTNLAELSALSLATNTLIYGDGTGSLGLTAFPAWARSMLGLTMAANKGVVGVDADTMATFDLTAAGLALLDDASAGAQRDTLTAFGVRRRQVFTTSGTYVPHPKMIACEIMCLGGGGGGAGAANSAAGQTEHGSSGGGGSQSFKIATAADIGASKAVTIGAAGSGGTAGNNAGGNGGDSSVGSLCVGKGGGGGSVSASRTGGAGGVAGTGDVTGTGARGNAGIVAGTGALNAVIGANSPMGGGGSGFPSTAGGAATGYGAGGCGGHSYNAGGTFAGGAGSQGIVVITEYCSS